MSISAVFDNRVDPDIAQVQVQNKVQQATARLPQQVQQQGVTVTKSPGPLGPNRLSEMLPCGGKHALPIG